MSFILYILGASIYLIIFPLLMAWLIEAVETKNRTRVINRLSIGNNKEA
jgi:hypothetical protein